MGAVAEQSQLFEAEQTYGVGEVAARITRAVASAFPAEIWVKGEVDGLRAPNASGHSYFNLCEKNSRRGPTSTIGMALFRADRLRVERVLRDWPEFRLANGLEIRVQGRVQYSYGRVQLVVSSVDPVHTLGRLAADRTRLLRTLAAEDLVEANGRLAVPQVPLHLGLVTSAGSAAYEDVIHELTASGIGFRISVADAQVQGNTAARSVRAALSLVAARRPDVVLLVRGGGARTDLATFDDEALARRIATLDIPVFTGIGHEIDTSVADEVASQSFKTPTACAAAVVEQVRLAVHRAETAWTGVTRAAESETTAADIVLGSRAVRVQDATSRALSRATSRLDAAGGGVAALVRSRLGSAASQVEASRRRLDPDRLERRLDRSATDLDAQHRRLDRLGSARVEAAATTLALVATRVDAADPARALARGWSITRTADGRLVRRAADLAPGATLRTTLADGVAESTVVVTP